MSYATAANLLQWFGAKELAQTATPDDMAMVTAQLLRLTVESGNRDGYSVDELLAADAALTRIIAALDAASSVLDSYLGRRYSLPISEEMVQTSPLPRSCGALARYLLYDDGVPVEVKQRYEFTLGWLRDLTNGNASLGGSSSSQSSVGVGMADFAQSERIFADGTLQGFVSDKVYGS